MDFPDMELYRIVSVRRIDTHTHKRARLIWALDLNVAGSHGSSPPAPALADGPPYASALVRVGSTVAGPMFIIVWSFHVTSPHPARPYRGRGLNGWQSEWGLSHLPASG